MTVRDRSPDESAAFLNSPSGDVLWSGTLSKNEVLGTSSYLEIAQKSYEEMFGSELPERDRLYGTHLAVEYELLDENGNGVLINGQVPGRFNDNFYVYRWIDAVGATEAFKEQGAIAAFHEKTDSGLGKVETNKEVDLFLPTSTNTILTTTNDTFTIPEVVKGTKTVEWQLNPTGLGLVGDTIGLKAGTTQVGAIIAQAQIDPNQVGHLITDNNANPIVLNPSQTTQNAINNTSTYDDVQIVIESLDNRFDSFLKQPISGNTSQQLWSGNLANFQQTFIQNGLEAQNFDEMLGTGQYQTLTKDRLYGTRVRVKYEFKQGGQTQDIVTDDHYIYRWINAHNPDPSLTSSNFNSYTGRVLFHRTFADGQGGFEREKEVELFLPEGVKTTFEKANFFPATSPSFNVSSYSQNPNNIFDNNQSSVIWTFDPATANDPNNPNSAKYVHRDLLEIMADGFNVGQLRLQGSATGPVEIGLDLDNFKTAMETMLSRYKPYGNPTVYFYEDLSNSVHNFFNPNQSNANFLASKFFVDDYQSFMGQSPTSLAANNQFQTQLNQEADDIYNEILKDLVNPLNNAANTQIAPIILNRSNQGNINNIEWDINWEVPPGKGGVTSLDQEKIYLNSNNANINPPTFSLEDVLKNTNNSEVAKFWALAEGINLSHQYPNQFTFTDPITNYPFPLEYQSLIVNLNQLAASYRQPSVIDYGVMNSFFDSYGTRVAETISHELAHMFGLNDAYLATTTTPIPQIPNDLMSAPRQTNLGFDIRHQNILQAALGIHNPNSNPNPNNSDFKSALDLFKSNFNLPNNSQGIVP